jgi:hemerythrin
VALIQWSSSLSVKVKQIDDEHQKLIKMINDLNDAMRVGKGKDVLGKIINELVNYAAVHFATEEKYFDQFGYQEATPHKSEHKIFVDEVYRFKKDFDEGRIGLSMKIMDFLSDWLKNHIVGIDQKYSSFFIEKGLK